MPATAISTILVPVDFSPCSRAALDYAAELADRMQAKVDVLYVDEPTEYFASMSALTPRDFRPRDDESRNDVLHELEGFIGGAKPQVRNVRVAEGMPGDVIPSVARDEKFDLIVMGTHGRGGLSRLVLGSVAETVMRKAQVPVLTLRIPKKEQRERIPL